MIELFDWIDFSNSAQLTTTSYRAELLIKDAWRLLDASACFGSMHWRIVDLEGSFQAPEGDPALSRPARGQVWSGRARISVFRLSLIGVTNWNWDMSRVCTKPTSHELHNGEHVTIHRTVAWLSRGWRCWSRGSRHLPRHINPFETLHSWLHAASGVQPSLGLYIVSMPIEFCCCSFRDKGISYIRSSGTSLVTIFPEIRGRH